MQHSWMLLSIQKYNSKEIAMRFIVLVTLGLTCCLSAMAADENTIQRHQQWNLLFNFTHTREANRAAQII